MKDSIGSLWIKEGRKGKFMSGKIMQMNGAELNIVVFKNDKGDNPKRPDYRIYLSEPRSDKPANYGNSSGNFTDDIPT